MWLEYTEKNILISMLMLQSPKIDEHGFNVRLFKMKVDIAAIISEFIYSFCRVLQTASLSQNPLLHVRPLCPIYSSCLLLSK